MTSNPQPENTLIVLCDPAGMPDCFNIVHLPSNDPCASNEIITRYINRYCDILRRGRNIPDDRIQVYEYGLDAHIENKFWLFTTDRQTLRHYIDSKNVPPSFDGSLRVAYHLHRLNGAVHSLDELIQNEKKPSDDLIDILAIKKNEDRNGVKNRTVESIETNHGTLYFGNNGFDFNRMNHYLQYIADHYFDPENHTLSFLNHTLSPGIPMLVDRAEMTKDMFRLHDQKPIEQKITYRLYQEFGHLQSTLHLLSMRPNQYDYKRFVRAFGLEVSNHNQTICTLLHIAENGVDSQVRPPERYRDEFQESLHLSQIDSSPENAGHKATSDIAKRILKTQFSIETVHADHPELNRRIEPTSIRISETKRNSHQI